MQRSSHLPCARESHGQSLPARATAPAVTPTQSQLVQLTLPDGTTALAFVTTQIQPGLMAVAIGDDAWFGTVEALDDARIVLRRAEGAFVLARDQVELLALVTA